MNTETAISVQNVSKKFRLYTSATERLYELLHPLRKQYHREFWALKDISLDLNKGEIIGILGRNGSGKSTLLQIICAVMQPTVGEIHTNGRISALLELGAGFNPEFSGRENVILNGAIMGFSRSEMNERMPKIEAFADIGEFFDQPVKTYSSGMFVRVAFGAAIHIDPEILIVDEALSVGDAKFQHRCFERIHNFVKQGKTILVVSHDTETLLRMCHRGVVLEKGSLAYIGPITQAINFYQNLLYGPAVKVESTPGLPEPSLDEQSAEDAIDLDSIQIRSLSADKADRVADKSCYNSHETRLGSQEVKIIDFDLIVNGELNPFQIEPHKEAELIIKLLFNKTIEKVSCGFAITTIDGIYIFGTNLDTMNRPFFSGQAGQCVIVKFRWKNHVSGAERFLNIGCHHYVDGEQRHLDVRRAVALMEFASTPDCIGFVDLELDFEIIEDEHRVDCDA